MEINSSTTSARGIFRLSHAAMRDFKSAYFTEKGVLLTDEEAQVKALKLLMLFKTIYKPVPKEVIINAGK
ncbi:MAG: hypothetical protein HY426_04160 [Candidatus Levybacteria bacterium]|nr:hypothetical protein [Candidatus Levybacteria bacterium]